MESGIADQLDELRLWHLEKQNPGQAGVLCFHRSFYVTTILFSFHYHYIQHKRSRKAYEPRVIVEEAEVVYEQTN